MTRDTPPDVLITESISGPAIDALARRFHVVTDLEAASSEERMAEYLPHIRAWIVRNRSLVTRSRLANAPRLQVVARAGVGLDNIDTVAAEELGVVVTFTPSANAVSVAELTMGLILASFRKIPAAHWHVANGGWDRHRFVGEELAGKALGLVGLGRIGREVAARAAAFGMRLLGYDPQVTPQVLGHEGPSIQHVSLPELLRSSDVVSLHVPLTDETRHLIDRQALKLMKPDGLLVNTSRGPIVDEVALVESLESNRIGGAALDVREVEPPVADRLERLPQVLLTPHIGAFTHAAQRRVTEQVAEDVGRVLAGEAALRAVGCSRPRRQ